MLRRKQISTRKIAKELLNEKSPDYVEYGRKIWFKYNFFAGSLVVSALYIALGIPFGEGLNGYYRSGLIILGIGIAAWIYGNHRSRPYSVSAMESKKPPIKKELLFNNETLKIIQKEKQKRIKMTLNCFKCCGWVFSFLIVGTIGDNIKEVFNLNSFHNYVLTLPIIIFMILLILASQTIIYYVSYGCKTVFVFCKSTLKKYVEKGLFVSNYVSLSAIEKIIQNHLPKNE